MLEYCTVQVSGAQKNVNPTAEPYTATATLNGTAKDNYVIATASATHSFTITQLVAEIEWKYTSLTYNGKEQIPVVYVKNKCSNDDDVKDDVSFVITGGAEDVGVYTATAESLTGEDASNYKMPTEDLTHLYSINKAKAEISVSIDDWTYGEAAKSPVVELTGVKEGTVATVEYKVYGAKNSTYTTTQPTKAGIYNIRASLNGNYNYETVTAEDSFTIEAKEVTLTWPDGDIEFTYNGNAQRPDVTVSGLINGDKGKVAAVVSGAATEVGTYTAT